MSVTILPPGEHTVALAVDEIITVVAPGASLVKVHRVQHYTNQPSTKVQLGSAENGGKLSVGDYTEPAEVIVEVIRGHAEYVLGDEQAYENVRFLFPGVAFILHDDTPDADIGAGFAGKGSLCIDSTNGLLYINEGDDETPDWVTWSKTDHTHN